MSTSNNKSARLAKLRQLNQAASDKLVGKFPHVGDWLLKKGINASDFRRHSQQILAATSLAGQIALNQPNIQSHVNQVFAQVENKDAMSDKISEEERLAVFEKMRASVQMPPGHLAKEDELYLEQQLSDILGFEVTAELDGHRLNHSIGIMGGEQHLRRYPTDALSNHDAYQESGIAPNRGAFGWFTENGELTPQAVLREKYYFAVQTLYLPDWNSNHEDLKPWYKYRKMVAINPAEEIAVVGVVGDAGPAQWVKKQYGGSPEIIREGKIWSPKSRGRVIMFFVDDPTDSVPLGPIDMKTGMSLLAMSGEQK